MTSYYNLQEMADIADQLSKGLCYSNLVNKHSIRFKKEVQHRAYLLTYIYLEAYAISKSVRV